MDILYYSLSDSLSTLNYLCLCLSVYIKHDCHAVFLIIQVNCNLYGQHPFFIGMEEKTGQAYGVFLLNSNAMRKSHTTCHFTLLFTFSLLLFWLGLKLNKS